MLHSDGRALGGLVLTSPVWLYQVWAYIAPALLAKEKKYALVFLLAAVPLFVGGVVLGYYIMPSAIAIMLGVHARHGSRC